MKITINDITYEVIKNEKDAIDEDVLKEKITELRTKKLLVVKNACKFSTKK